MTWWWCLMKIEGIHKVITSHLEDVWTKALGYLSNSYFTKSHKYQPHGHTRRKCQWITKVGGSHHLETTNGCTKCHPNPSNYFWDISVWTQNGILTNQPINISLPKAGRLSWLKFGGRVVMRRSMHDYNNHVFTTVV